MINKKAKKIPGFVINITLGILNSEILRKTSISIFDLNPEEYL